MIAVECLATSTTAAVGRPLDLGGHPGDPLAVQAASRLVKHQQVRVGDEGLGHQRALRVAARERLKRHLGRVRQAQPAHHVPGAAGRLVPAEPGRPGQPGKPVVQGDAGEYPGPLGSVAHGTGPDGRASVGQQPGGRGEQRGLPRAVRPLHRDDIAG